MSLFLEKHFVSASTFYQNIWGHTPRGNTNGPDFAVVFNFDFYSHSFTVPVVRLRNTLSVTVHESTSLFSYFYIES